MKELGSLIDSACVGPAINTTWFPAEPGGYAWSSSPYAGGADYAWLVMFEYGDHYIDFKYSELQVRLVRSGQ